MQALLLVSRAIDSFSERFGKLLSWLVVAAVAVFYLSGMSGAEVAKDDAIADAAQDVGAAAGQVGDAAQDAADAVTD